METIKLFFKGMFPDRETRANIPFLVKVKFVGVALASLTGFIAGAVATVILGQVKILLVLPVSVFAFFYYYYVAFFPFANGMVSVISGYVINSDQKNNLLSKKKKTRRIKYVIRLEDDEEIYVQFYTPASNVYPDGSIVDIHINPDDIRQKTQNEIVLNGYYCISMRESYYDDDHLENNTARHNGSDEYNEGEYDDEYRDDEYEDGYN